MERAADSPTVQLLSVLAAVFVVQQIGGLVGLDASWFALAAPLAARPWTVVTSVYAHAGLSHLLANAVALVLVGLVLERATSGVRFHAFVLVSGAVAGVSEVVLSGLVGRPTAVLGASGAVLALVGYVVSGNRVSGAVLSRLDLSRRAKVGLLIGVAIAVAVVTGGPGVALTAHVTGLLLGVIAGRLGLLRVGSAENATLK